MAKNLKNFFGLLGAKAISPTTSTVTAFEATREGQPKAYIPNFFYKPPFGYPRYKDLNYYRQLAASIYVDMCETAIIDEVCSIEWDIVAEDRAGNEVPGKEADVERITQFFENPNTNKESWESIVRMMLPDLLELNSGVMVKTFNAFGKFVEIVARDGGAFTKNPDPYGMYTNKADLILVKDIMGEQEEEGRQNLTYPLLGGALTSEQAKEDAAYFQYGHNTAARPVPFGKREIVWFEKKLRTDDLYGRSAMEVLAKTVQTLVYAVESQLEYFSDNSIPQGVLGLDGMSTDDMKAFAQQWTESQKVKDTFGNWKKKFHKLSMVNKMPKFERLSFSNQELELIESQKWWSKMVWAAFGITATELGFTEDAAGAGNQIVQTSIAKKRIIYPLLRLIEYHVNTEIIPEFGVEGIRYKYKIFDIDEETKKWGLYKMQTDSDLKTINEIRNSEGLEALEGGDETGSMRADRQQAEDRAAFSDEPLQQESDQINRDSQNTRDSMNAKKKEYLKYKYAKRTGSPGNYIYWYWNPKKLKLESGQDPTKKPKREEDNSPFKEGGKEYQGEKGKNNLSHERFDLSKAKLLSDNGYGRTVYELPDGKVIKIARNLNGLQQNDLEGNKENKLLPKLYERGKDYVVVENVKRDDAKSKELLKPLNKFGMSDFDRDKPQELKDEFNKLDKKYPGVGFKEALKYNMWSEDFLNPENWGWKEERPYHIDAGTFDVTLLGQDEDDLEPKYGDKWKEIVRERKKGKKEGDKVITGEDETKAMTTDSPLTLQPNEEMGPKELESGIKRVLDKNRKKFLEILDDQFKDEPLVRIKSIDNLPKMIKQFFAAFALKELSDQVIKSEFDDGWDKSEKQIQKNVPYNNKALEFLQNHTFDNIKGMTEEISNDLKQELERGIINGEGITKLKERVNKVFDVGDNRAEMIARTETNRADNNGKLLAVKGSDVDKEYNKKWVTHEDDRTSPICNRLDGQVVGVNMDFKDPGSPWEGQSPPSHVNCRSSIVFVAKDEE